MPDRSSRPPGASAPAASPTPPDLAYDPQAVGRASRLAAVRATGLLDTPEQPALERLTRLAARLLRVPTALATLVDVDRQFFASSIGLAEPWAGARQTPLTHSFCQHVVAGASALVVEDARVHPLVRDNRAIPDLGVVAYAGIPLRSADGHVLGSFCAIDARPRAWSPDELATLEELTRSASAEIELRVAVQRMHEQARLLDARSDELAELLDATAELVCTTGRRGRITFVNRAWREAFGHSADDAGALRPIDLVEPEHHARVADAIRALRAGTIVDDLELVVRARERRRICRGRAVPIMADTPDGPQYVGTRAFFRDVTPEHDAAVALRASESRFRAALDGGRFGFVALGAVHDAAGTVVDFEIVAVNAQGAALIGMPEEDLIGQRYGELLPLARQAGHIARYARVLATGRTRESEVRVTDPRFAAEWLRIQAVALDDENGDGAPDGVALMVRDVGEEKTAAREVRLFVDVTQALSSAHDAGEAIGAALVAMCAASGWEYGEAWLVAGDDASAHEAPARLVRGPTWHAPSDALLAAYARASEALTFARDSGLPGRAWAAAAPVVLPRLARGDVAFERLEAARAAGLRSGVAIPVLADGSVVAVLVFHTRDPHRVGRAPVALLAAVAAQVGTVVRRKLAESALAEREARLGLIYNSATDLMFLMRVERDALGDVQAFRCESVNDAYLAVTGLMRSQLIGRCSSEILPPEGAAFVLQQYRLAEASGDVMRYDEEVALPTGRLIVETTLTPVLDDAGRCTHLLGAARDVSATRRAQAAMRESEARFRGVLENLRAPAVQLDADGRVTFANAAVLAMTGWTHEETLGADWFGRFVPDAETERARFAVGVRRGALSVHHEGEVLTRTGDRRLVAWDNVALRDPDDAIVGVASVGQDITERRALEARLSALSEHDELTGLLNRRGFHRMGAHALRSGLRTQRHDAVLYIDLDRFKPINDTYGHAAGDAALRAVADVVRATVRDADFAGRLGGDEFAIFAIGLRRGEGGILAERLRAELEAHNAAATAAGRPFPVEFSIGVSELEAGDDLESLLARGDAALYAEKCVRRLAAAGAPAAR